MMRNASRITALTFVAAALFSISCRGERRRETPPAQVTATASTPAPAVSTEPELEPAQAQAPVEQAPATPPPGTTCVPAADRLCPVDQASTDPAFATYREQLREAVREKDETKLLTLVDEKIRTSFGEGGGTADLIQQWHLDSTQSSFWREMQSILDLGGSFRGSGKDRMFWAPYVYSNWPEHFDAFEYVAAVKPSVVLHTQPSATSPLVASADWGILGLVHDERTREESPSWKHVRTSDGKAGWVAAADVRSPVGYRAGFSRRSSEWKMTALVSGD